MSVAPARRLVIGIGNPDRGDDAAGRAVARRLRSREGCAADVRECAGEASALMEAWAGYDDVVLVDACRASGPAVAVHRIGPDQLDRVASLRHASTHSFGVAAAIGLSRELGTLPKQLVIYAIDVCQSRLCEGLSPEVDHAVDQVVAALVAEQGAATDFPPGPRS